MFIYLRFSFFQFYFFLSFHTYFPTQNHSRTTILIPGKDLQLPVVRLGSGTLWVMEQRLPSLWAEELLQLQATLPGMVKAYFDLWQLWKFHLSTWLNIGQIQNRVQN